MSDHPDTYLDASILQSSHVAQEHIVSVASIFPPNANALPSNAISSQVVLTPKVQILPPSVPIAPRPIHQLHFSGFRNTSLEGRSNLVCVLTIVMNCFRRSSSSMRPLNRLNRAPVVIPDVGTCARSSATVGTPSVSAGAALGAGDAISMSVLRILMMIWEREKGESQGEGEG